MLTIGNLILIPIKINQGILRQGYQDKKIKEKSERSPNEEGNKKFPIIEPDTDTLGIDGRVVRVSPGLIY